MPTFTEKFEDPEMSFGRGYAHAAAHLFGNRAAANGSRSKKGAGVDRTRSSRVALSEPQREVVRPKVMLPRGEHIAPPLIMRGD